VNAAGLMAVWDRISDAPDAVGRLHRFVLDLAVRGKLVEQRPEEEPALSLLRQVGRMKAQREPACLPMDDTPFPLPQGWAWTNIAGVCSKTGSGSTPRGGREVYRSNGVLFLRSQNVYDDGLRLDDVAYIDPATHARMDSTAVLAGDLLLNITGGSIGRCCLVPPTITDANVSQHVAIIRTDIDGLNSYLHLLIRSPYFQSFVIGEQTGAGRGGLPKNRMDRIPVAVPPAGEQLRIVAKVDELMALCDRLEAARVERESRRDRLVTATLTRMASSPADDGTDSIQADTGFIGGHLSHLTTRPAHIGQVRATLLDLAVRGRLMLPGPWAQSPVRIGTIARLQNGYAFKSDWFSPHGVRLLRNANVAHGTLRWDDVVYLPQERAAEFERFALNENDIVLSLDRPFIVTGTKVARVAACDLPSLLLQRVGRFVFDPSQLTPDWLYCWIYSLHFTQQIDPGRSNGVPHIVERGGGRLDLPSPPRRTAPHRRQGHRTHGPL